MIENLHLPENFKEKLEGLGEIANEEYKLTTLQQFALPILLWFFDNHRFIGQSRTQLAAHVVIELAKRGNRVNLVDVSRLPLCKYNYKDNRYFCDVVADIFMKNYKDDIFAFEESGKTLVYIGRKPE